MATDVPQDIKTLITSEITDNGNEEITAAVLRPVLLAMVGLVEGMLGADLNDLSTQEKSDTIAAINEIYTKLETLQLGDIKTFRGSFDTYVALTTAIPVGNDGDYAFLFQDEDLNDGFFEYRWNVATEKWEKETDPIYNFLGGFTNTYDDIAEMLSEQAEQNTLNRILVQDASADPNITFASGETKLQAEYRFNGTATGSIDDYTLISAPYGNHTGGSIPASKTGTTIEFTENAVYNEASYLESGNLTLDLTDAVKGSVVVVYCKKYAPTISGETFYISSGALDTNDLNILSFFYDGTTIWLNIGNVEVLSPPTIVLTAGDEEITIDWGAVFGADNYILERDTDSGFGTATEIYNGALLTFTDTGLTNDTTYYYRAKSQGEGYIESGWSSAQNETPTEGADPTLLLHLDASDYSTVTTSNGAVTEWRDKTAYNNDLTEATKTPTHSEANNNIAFTGTDGTIVDVLSRTISDLYFQQSDDFTVLIKGLKFTSGTAETGQHVLNNKLSVSNPKGWSINLAANGLTLFLSQHDGSTQNFASLALGGSGFKDDMERDLIFINEGGVLKIYDETNTNVGTNGTTSIGAITYTGVKFRVGCAEASINKFPFIGDLGLIKIWNRVLDSTERAAELA